MLNTNIEKADTLKGILAAITSNRKARNWIEYQPSR